MTLHVLLLRTAAPHLWQNSESCRSSRTTLVAEERLFAARTGEPLALGLENPARYLVACCRLGGGAVSGGGLRAPAQPERAGPDCDQGHKGHQKDQNGRVVAASCCGRCSRRPASAGLDKARGCQLVSHPSDSEGSTPQCSPCCHWTLLDQVIGQAIAFWDHRVSRRIQRERLCRWRHLELQIQRRDRIVCRIGIGVFALARRVHPADAS